MVSVRRVSLQQVPGWMIRQHQQLLCQALAEYLLLRGQICVLI